MDAYGDKRGAETLAEMEAKWGPLPPTIVSTSRDDGVSSIRLYRVRPMPGWHDVGLDVETVHFGCRYMLVWPSVHPETGATYRWIDLRTGEVIEYPRPEDGAWMPDTWQRGLARTEAPADKDEVSHSEVEEWLRALPNGPACHATKQALKRFRADLAAAGSRHNAARDRAAGLLRVGEMGHHGVRDAVEQAQAEFLSAVAADRGRRSPAEWRRMITGGVGLVVAKPTAPEDHGCRCAPDLPPFEPDLGAAASNGAGGGQDSDQAGDGGPRGFPVLSRAQLREFPPPVEWTIEGAVQHGEITLAFGQPKSAKSLVVLDMGAHVAAGWTWSGRAVRQGHVVYVCLENKSALNQRLSAWEDAHPDAALMTEEYFHAVVVPVGATKADMSKLVDGIDEALPETPRLVIVDTAQRFAARAGLNETAEDTSQVFDLLDRLKEHYPCAVLLVHHAGKDLDRGARGSNVYSGSPTTVLETSKPAESRTVKLRCTESNNASDGWEEYWNIAVTFKYDEKYGTPYLFPMLGPAGDGGDGERRRAQQLVDKVVEAVNAGPDGVSRRTLLAAVGGGREKAEEAIGQALVQRLIVERSGARGARLFYPAGPAGNV